MDRVRRIPYYLPGSRSRQQYSAWGLRKRPDMGFQGDDDDAEDVGFDGEDDGEDSSGEYGKA